MHRAFDVLRFFAQQRRPLAIKQIAKTLDAPISSTSLLVKSLASLSLLSYDRATRRYFVTIEVARLGDWIETALVGQLSLQDLCEGISRTTGETVTVSMQNDVHMQFLHIARGPQAARLALKHGQQVSIVGSAIGFALLGTRPLREVRRLARRALRVDCALADGLTVEDVLRRTRAARRDGFAVERGSVLPGTAAIALALPANISTTQLVVGVGGPGAQILDRRHAIIAAIRREVDEWCGAAKTAPRRTAVPGRPASPSWATLR